MSNFSGVIRNALHEKICCQLWGCVRFDGDVMALSCHVMFDDLTYLDLNFSTILACQHLACLDLAWLVLSCRLR